jgi:hypothetical protein
MSRAHVLLDILQNFLTEAYRGKLFHATNFIHAQQALEQDRLKVSPQFVGISFTRNPNFWYNFTLNPVRFILDGNRLSQKYRIEPYNYAGDPTKSVSEQEEVVRQDIHNLRRYLIGIEVHKHKLPPGALEYLQQVGVPVFYHGRIPPMAPDRGHKDWEKERYHHIIPPQAISAYRYRKGL